MNEKQYEAANKVKSQLQVLNTCCDYIDTAMAELPIHHGSIRLDLKAGEHTLTLNKELTQRVLESMYNTIDKRIVELNKKFSEL